MREYLSPQHRDDPGTGCPNAALLDEIGRCGDAVRDSYTRGMQSIVEVIATHLSPKDPSAARTTALGLFTILVATMQLARAVSDREFSDEILRSGILERTATHLSIMSDPCPNRTPRIGTGAVIEQDIHPTW